MLDSRDLFVKEEKKIGNTYLDEELIIKKIFSKAFYEINDNDILSSYVKKPKIIFDYVFEKLENYSNTYKLNLDLSKLKNIDYLKYKKISNIRNFFIGKFKEVLFEYIYFNSLKILLYGTEDNKKEIENNSDSVKLLLKRGITLDNFSRVITSNVIYVNIALNADKDNINYIDSSLYSNPTFIQNNIELFYKAEPGIRKDINVLTTFLLSDIKKDKYPADTFTFEVFKTVIKTTTKEQKNILIQNIFLFLQRDKDLEDFKNFIMETKKIPVLIPTNIFFETKEKMKYIYFMLNNIEFINSSEVNKFIKENKKQFTKEIIPFIKILKPFPIFYKEEYENFNFDGIDDYFIYKKPLQNNINDNEFIDKIKKNRLTSIFNLETKQFLNTFLLQKVFKIVSKYNLFDYLITDKKYSLEFDFFQILLLNLKNKTKLSKDQLLHLKEIDTYRTQQQELEHTKQLQEDLAKEQQQQQQQSKERIKRINKLINELIIPYSRIYITNKEIKKRKEIINYRYLSDEDINAILIIENKYIQYTKYSSIVFLLEDCKNNEKQMVKELKKSLLSKVRNEIESFLIDEYNLDKKYKDIISKVVKTKLGEEYSLADIVLNNSLERFIDKQLELSDEYIKEIKLNR